MKVNVINEYRIEMELAEEELSDFDVTYETLDYGDVNTRRFLRELASSAKNFGVEADMSGRVLIETFRTREGCRVCFTFLPPHGKDTPSVKQLVKKDAACLCITGTDIGVMSRLCAALGKIPESSLYYRGGRYELFLFAGPETLLRCADAAAEYGTEIGTQANLRLARCSESALRLVSSGAVERLASL